VSVYVGSGAVALAAARADAEARAERAAEAAAGRRERERIEAAGRALGDLCRDAIATANALIQAHGYYLHKRQWRRRRPMARPAEDALATSGDARADEIFRVLKRAQAGDRSVVPQLRAMFDEKPEIVGRFLGEGHRELATAAEDAVIESVCGPTCGPTNLLQREILIRDLARTATELAGADPTPAERLLARRAALCWNVINIYECSLAKHEGITFQQVDFDQRQIDRVHRRLLQTLRTLATVRRLARGGPLVSVNVEQSVRVEAGTAAVSDPRPGLSVPDLMRAAPRG
jgi:hypothetical protein